MKPVIHLRFVGRQRGAVMLISLILLVALTLAGLALIRSTSTTNVIAGNLAFQQSATHSADIGVETAIAWIAANTGAALESSSLTGPGTRYVAKREDPPANQSWDAFWTGTLAASGAVNTLPTDARTGNTVSYVIHRLCNTTGPALASNCSASPTDTGTTGNSKGGGTQTLNSNKQVYYRITARVTGPRNTLSYVQVVVAI